MADEIQTDPTEQAEQTAQLAAESHVVQLAHATSQHHAAREFAIAAMGRGEMTELQAADYMLAFSRQVVAAKDAAGGKPVEPEVTGSPRLSRDPAEAQMGLTEPEAPDVHAIERMLEHHPDVDLRRPGALRLAQALSAKVPRELVPEATNLLLTFKAMAEDPARTQEWTAELAQKELERRHGAKEAEGLVKDAQKLWRELGDDRDLFADEEDWIGNDPDALEKLAEFSDLYFSSDAGMRVTLKRNAAAAAAQDRDRAERAAAERALDARFRDIR